MNTREYMKNLEAYIEEHKDTLTEQEIFALRHQGMGNEEPPEEEVLDSQIDVDPDFQVIDKTEEETHSPFVASLLLFVEENILNLRPEHTVYNTTLTYDDNPLLDQEPPYELSTNQFFYYIFQSQGVELFPKSDMNKKKALLLQRQLLTEVGRVGSRTPVQELHPGDILFFGVKDQVTALYIGSGEFITWTGRGQRDVVGGLEKHSFTEPKWQNEWYGHVKRITL